MEKIIKFFVLNISIFFISFFLLIIFLKYYLNINIISIGFLSFGFKYVSKQINPLIESIKINCIKLQYKRVKYSKSKVFILSIAGVQLQVSPTFVKNISKKEESKFLRKLSKKIIDGIYNYNYQNEYRKNFEDITNSKYELSGFSTVNINDCDTGSRYSVNKNDNSKLSNNNLNNNNNRKYSNTSYLNVNKKNYMNSTENLRKSKKENLNISSTTLYSSNPKKSTSVFQTFLYMLDNKYIFEIIIPIILSKIAINITDINVEVKFPEGSKVEFKQEYISLSSSKKELGTESKNKYFDYILFKKFNPYNFKIRFLFSEFYLKFYEVNHSYYSQVSKEQEEKDNDVDSEKEDNIEYNYIEYDILKSDEKNSIIISSIYNCINTKTNCNFAFNNIKCDSDGWINLIRLYTILKKIFENYFDMGQDKKNDKKNSKKKGYSNEEKNVINKYKNMIITNKKLKYIKAKFLKNSPLKKYSTKNKHLHKNFCSEQYCARSVTDSNGSLKSDISSNEFDNSNLNSFMNNEIIQIFFFHLRTAKINYNFQILNFQLTSVSHFCGYRPLSKSSLTSSSTDDMYAYNQKPQFLNVITIGEISFKGEAYKSKSKLYNIVTSISLKNLYLDIIDYNINFIVQFFNIKSIYIKLEAIFQFYKFKQHLSYMKNINFDFNISTINLNFDFDYSYGLFQHFNYVIKKLDNKYQFNHDDDPLFNINKLIVVSRATSLQDLSNKNNKLGSNFNIDNSSIYNEKSKNKNSLNDIINLTSKYNKKLSKLKININFTIKNIILNYIILSEKIQNYYSINNAFISLPNECILIQFGIKNAGIEYSNSKKIKLQSILSSSTVSVNSDKIFDSETKINGSFSSEDYDKYVLYEEQPGLHEIEFEINNITLNGSFVPEDKIFDKNMIRVNELMNYEKNHGISLDKFTTKIVFSVLSIEKNIVNVKKDDKFLIGTYFGNLKFNFGSSKLSSNTLIIIIDLLRLKLLQLSKQFPLQKTNNNIYDSNVSISTSCGSSYAHLEDINSNSKLKRNNIYYSTPELYFNKNSVNTVEPLHNEVLSSVSVNTNSSSNLGSSYENVNNNGRKQKGNFFNYYMFIFDLKISTISFSILNPEDECGFQSDIKKVLFHYNNNCYITHNTNNNRKLIIKPNNKIKNQFSFNIKEIDLYYLDTIKYLKKGIVMHNFLKLNDIAISLVDVSSTSLSSINDLSSIGSISTIESSMDTIAKMKLNNDSINFNKINFNIKKIRIYFSLDVFFGLLSTVNSVLIKIVKPFISTIEKSMSQSINDVTCDIDSRVLDSSFNCNIDNKLEKGNSVNSVHSSSKNNLLSSIKLNVENIQLELDMPDNIKLFIYLKDNSISYLNSIRYDASKILVLLPSQMNKKSNLLKIKNLYVTYNMNKNDITKQYNNTVIERENSELEVPPALNVFGDVIVVSIPYLFDLSDVIDSVVHMMKTMKNIFYKVIFNKEYKSTPTIIEVDEMIKALICFNMVSLQFVENEFESNLSKIFFYGLREQKERVAREIAFGKKINDLRNIKNQAIKAESNMNNINSTSDNNNPGNTNNTNNANVNITSSQPANTTSTTNSTVNPIHNLEEDNATIEEKILKASQRLKIRNSKFWIDIVKQYKSNTPPNESSLMGSITLYDLKALVDKPTLLGKTSEETIHIIDENTPADKIYDTLVPIKLTLKIGSGSMELRDYPEKMLYIPESNDGSNRPSAIFNISVFITEQDPNEECKKYVNVKYFHNRRMETILRTINPTKIYYYGAKLVIQTNQRAGFSWGYSNDPVFTHILQTISAFSKDSYDPSEKLPWWDKMRLNFHGSLDVVITQGCEFDVHILGSCSPYYTLDSDYFGNDGLNIIFGKGVNIKLGNTGVKDEVLRICCGEVFDSFSGFRTKNIHMNINLSSPSYNFSGLNYQHNYIHLSLDAINYIINFTEFMSMGVLGLPVGVGPLFNKKVDKKIPMDISELNIKINLMPLMIGLSSYINDDCFPNEFMIGIRCKAQTFNMELSMVYKDEESKELEFTYSNAIITSVEGKAYTLGNATTEEAKLYSFKGDELNDDDDIYCWRNDLDKFYIYNNIPINTKFLFHSAYVSYFKRNAIGDSEKLKKEYQIIENGNNYYIKIRNKKKKNKNKTNKNKN
ncbi:hypothetical protein PIROE2DRAFT_56942 [Piromyces sp. E2]|nr:hypothetical protein PIROE2DRAFT_56942 [Piromyces sp. E2]|eukprot:OUM70268.1 hypothetical protein PIROE2DRAFT_56942 [Piromyces sp. E2]